MKQATPPFDFEHWDAVNDGLHNSNTDLIYWKDAFYLVHAASPFHLASKKCKLVIRRSLDARWWEQVAEIKAPGEDIRDPKFGVIQGRLWLYALKNVDINPEPYGTVFSVSDDGVSWPAFEEIEPTGWLFWRPKSMDGKTWYIPAYWSGHGKSALLKSEDGRRWILHSIIHEGDRNDETDIEFLPDGRMISTARLEFGESVFGHPDGSTLITVSEPPYTNWSAGVKDKITRLDGPSLFSYREQVFAVGRYQPKIKGPFAWQGSAFTQKRTSLFVVRESGLLRLFDFPSSGDTSYSGVVLRGDDLYISYYTSDITRDPWWIVGMLSPSSIRIVKLDMKKVAKI